MYKDELTHYAVAKPNDSHYAVAYDAEYLEHYGKKGMKWGVRNEPESTGTRRKKGLSKGAKIALGVGAGVLGTAALAGGGYALYKSGIGTEAAKAIGTAAKSVKATQMAKKINVQKAKSLKQTTKQAKQTLLSKEGNVERLARLRAKKATEAAAEKALQKQHIKDITKQARTEAGEEFIKNTIKGMGGVASKAVTGGVAIVGKKAVANMLAPDTEVAAYTFPNPNKKK